MSRPGHQLSLGQHVGLLTPNMCVTRVRATHYCALAITQRLLLPSRITLASSTVQQVATRRSRDAHTSKQSSTWCLLDGLGCCRVPSARIPGGGRMWSVQHLQHTHRARTRVRYCPPLVRTLSQWRTGGGVAILLHLPLPPRCALHACCHAPYASCLVARSPRADSLPIPGPTRPTAAQSERGKKIPPSHRQNRMLRVSSNRRRLPSNSCRSPSNRHQLPPQPSSVISKGLLSLSPVLMRKNAKRSGSLRTVLAYTNLPPSAAPCHPQSGTGP